MADYELPKSLKPTKTKKNQVLLVASGDLRLSANQVCWPAQQEMEQALTRSRGRRRIRTGSSPSLQARAGTRLHRFAERRHAGLCQHRSQGKADRGRSRLAILPPCAVRFALARRPHPHGGQLVGHVAGTGRHAQPEWLTHESGAQVFDAVERRFHRPAVRRRAGAGWRKARSSTRPTTSRRSAK